MSWILQLFHKNGQITEVKNQGNFDQTNAQGYALKKLLPEEYDNFLVIKDKKEKNDFPLVKK